VNKPNDASRDGQASPSLPHDDHVPMNGFNVAEVDALLKKGYDARAPLYKPDSLKPQPASTGSPWGAKREYNTTHLKADIITNTGQAGAMASGKDFWLELRKQITALQQTGGTSQGG